MIGVFIHSTFGNVDERSDIVLGPNVFDVKANAKHKSSRVRRNGNFIFFWIAVLIAIHVGSMRRGGWA